MTAIRRPVPRVPQVHANWELLEFDDGDLFWNNVHGRHRKVRKPGRLVRETLRRVDGVRTRAEIAGELVGAGLARGAGEIDCVVATFARMGMLVEAPETARPAWLDADLFGRFRTEIEWFDTFATERVGGYDYFARLRAARVGIIGLGAAGSLCAALLTAAGAGHLRLIDGDTVETSNLVRQLFYREDQAGAVTKVDAMAEYLRRFSRFTEVEPICAFVESPADARALLGGLDFVLLCADAPRFLLVRYVDEVCAELGLPYLNAFSNLVGPMFVPGVSPCFGCLEAHLRAEMGPDYDRVIKALQKPRPQAYPSFAPGPVQTGNLLSLECMGYLTNAWQPLTVGAVLRPGYGGAEATPLAARADCARCAPRPRPAA
jgi:hypothetical protein